MRPIFFALSGIFLSFLLSVQLPLKAQNTKETSSHWHEQIVRKLFFDYHNNEANSGLAENFDAEAWADQLQAAHAEGVSMFAKGAQGWRYYQKGEVGWIHPEMPEGLDMLGEVVEACHKRDIRVIAYYHTFSSKKIEELYPDWRAMTADNEPAGLCMNTPLLEEHMLPQIKEIVGNYDIDGIFFDGTNIRNCHCPYCQKDFMQDTGFEIPENSDDPHHLAHVKWLNEKSTQLRQKIMDAVHEEKPEVLVSFNWSYTPRQPELIPDDLGYLMCDIFPQDQVLSGSYLGKYWSTLGISFDIMNTAFLRWWGDWGCKPAVAMQQECATIIANGGKLWLGHMMPAQFGVEPAIMDELGKTMAFVKEREEFCLNSTPVPYIAVLHSTHSLYTKDPTTRLNEEPLYSIHKMLVENGYHYNIVNEKTLLEKIHEYKVVILPDQRFIGEELAGEVEKFVQNGGGLIATVMTGTQDSHYQSTENFILEKVLGVKWDGLYPYTHGYMVVKDKQLQNNFLDMPHQVWGDFVYVKPENAQTLADLWDVYLRNDGEYYQGGSSPPGKNTGYPAVTVNTYGKGKAVYMAGDIFSSYATRNNWNLKNLFGNLVEQVLPEKLVSIEPTGEVEVVLKKQQNKTQIHLINHWGERAFNNTIAYTESINPVHNIKIHVKVEKRPDAVKLMPENKDLKWELSADNTLTVNVPELNIYSIIVVE